MADILSSTWSIRSSPVTTATLRSTSAFLAASCRAAAQPSGFTPPALLTTRTPLRWIRLSTLKWLYFKTPLQPRTSHQRLFNIFNIHLLKLCCTLRHISLTEKGVSNSQQPYLIYYSKDQKHYFELLLSMNIIRVIYKSRIYSSNFYMFYWLYSLKNIKLKYCFLDSHIQM